MSAIGIIRCEKNEERCPLTNCLKSLENSREGFKNYANPELIGIFTCRCPGDKVGKQGKILKSKGADTIHICTCTFSHKEKDGWRKGNGFCDHIDNILKNLAEETGLVCVKGTAHLPPEYEPEILYP